MLENIALKISLEELRKKFSIRFLCCGIAGPERKRIPQLVFVREGQSF
jgi:hypothetical protein